MIQKYMHNQIYSKRTMDFPLGLKIMVTINLLSNHADQLVMELYIAAIIGFAMMHSTAFVMIIPRH
jgi:hypothetical protein